jgi:putative DNA primase/helicase
MRPDGSILSERGYDIPTGILMQPSAVFPPVPVNPTQMEVMESGKALLEPISDFPFRGASDRAAAIAAILSLVARPAIDGPIPMFAFRAPAPGTGKSLLADVISMIGTGRHPSHMAQPDDDVELRKLILTIAMQGLPLLVIDNAAGKIGSPALSAALTSSSWQDRILGSNKVIDAPLRCVWLVTGNNITFKGDLARRVVASDLDAGLEHPEDRPEETFSHYPLIEWVATERPRLVSAVLTLLRGFHMAGRPKHGAPQKGSFESWDSLVRGCLIWSGIGDPDEGKERIRSEDDSDTIPLAELFRQLKAASLGFPFTTAEIIEKAKSDSGLESALMEAVNRPKLDARGLGYVLRNCKDRIVEGLRVCVSKSDGGRSANKWIVRGDSESGV